METNMFPKDELVYLTFGPAAAAYGPQINDIWESLSKDKYFFEDNDVYFERSFGQEKDREYAGRVYWTEILNRAHIASVAAIFRSTEWVDVAVRERRAGSLYGWAAGCRGLIESAGDTMESLRQVPPLAELNRNIKCEIDGKG